MKKIYIIISITFAITGIIGCKKDNLLNLYPLSSISQQNFFKNETDLQLYCNQFYSNLPIQSFVNVDDNSDDKANKSINSFLAGTYTVPTTASGAGWDFSTIRACNYFLANYQQANETDSVKNIYVGETKFFRALDYWNKVKTWGDVPYVNHYITDTSASVLYGPRTPRNQVMDSVLNDLNFAVAYIPYSTSDGRLNKYCALALKARICLWEGTYRKYRGSDGTTYLQAAADAADQIINSGVFSIYSTGNPKSDYYNLFIQAELKGNPEAIMPMRYLQDILMNGVDRQLGESGDGYSKDFVRSYLCMDGLPTALSSLYKGDDSLDQEIINRDPRLAQSIATRGFAFLGTDTITIPRVGTGVTSTGYQCIKGRSSDIAAWNANASVYDFFIFRYAETLLIDAEAKAELGTCTQTVIDNTINKLRDRVGMPHMIIANLVRDPNSHFPGISVLLDEIRRERRVELASEGFRFDDLNRWHAGTLINNPETVLGVKILPASMPQYTSGIVVNANNYVVVYPGITRTWNDKLYFYPIPIDQITLAGYSQNPGW